MHVGVDVHQSGRLVVYLSLFWLPIWTDPTMRVWMDVLPEGTLLKYLQVFPTHVEIQDHRIQSPADISVGV